MVTLGEVRQLTLAVNAQAQLFGAGKESADEYSTLLAAVGQAIIDGYMERGFETALQSAMFLPDNLQLPNRAETKLDELKGWLGTKGVRI